MAHAAERLIEFRYKTPTTGAALRENVRAALASGRPDAEPRPARFPNLHIVANGPTAAHAPLDASFTLAVNGSLKLFTERGLAPTFWACVDPKKMIAGFLDNAPRRTHYLVNSQCHPSVLEALRGYPWVSLWHSYNEAFVDLLDGRTVIDAGTTITLNALPLLHMLGYRSFDVWGWDGCYLGGKDHAVAQKHRRRGSVDLKVGFWRRPFKTTPTWALEAQEAVALLSQVNYRVRVRGSGMIGSILRHAGVRAGFP